MNIHVLNSTKSWLAENRSNVRQGVEYFKMANTAAYLTNTISTETYSTALLSGIAAGFAFSLLDSLVSCAADKNISMMSENEANKKAELILRAHKAEAAFFENPSLQLFLEAKVNFPDSETILKMNPWEQFKEYASLLKTPLSIYLFVQQGNYIRNTFEKNLWIPAASLGFLSVILETKGVMDEQVQDIKKLEEWLKKLQAINPEDKEHPIYQELQEHLTPILNRSIARIPDLGIALAEQFQSYGIEIPPKK